MFVTLVALPCTDSHCVILYLMNLTIIDFSPHLVVFATL